MIFYRKCTILLFFSFFTLLTFFWCPVTPITAKEITVHDSFGRPVNVPIPIRRAVFFEAYEFIPALDIWDCVVGISRHAYTNDLLKWTRPDLKKQIPSAGTAWHINMETLLQQSPELVLTWAVRRQQVEYIEKCRLRVLSLYPERVKEVDELVFLFGRLFGKEERGRLVLGAMEEVARMMEATRQDDERTKPRRVLWLGMRPTSVAGQGGLVNDLIRLSGARNAAEEIRTRYAEVPMEKVIAWNPEVIFIWGHAPYGVDVILHDEKWQSIRAVKERRIYRLPPWSTCSPRVYLLGLWMAMKIYPEKYGDLPFATVKKRFYERVFGANNRGVER